MLTHAAPRPTHNTDAELAAPIKIVREAQGRTQRSVALQAGVAPAQLSRAERCLGSLSLDSLYKISRVLHMDELTRHLEPYLQDRTLIDRSTWDRGRSAA